MIGYGKAGLITLALWLGYLSFSSAAKADQEDDFENTFEEADSAFVEGNFTRGTQMLNKLITDHPGNFDLATRALHRICLSEYMELVANDWPSSGYPWISGLKRRRPNYNAWSRWLRHQRSCRGGCAWCRAVRYIYRCRRCLYNRSSYCFKGA